MKGPKARKQLPPAPTSVRWTRVLAAGSVFSLMGLAAWVFWPIPKQFVPHYTSIPKHAARVVEVRAETMAPPIHKAPPKKVAPDARIAPVDPYVPVASRICETEIAHLLAEKVENSRGCMKEFANVNGEIQKALKRKADEGIQIDLENCIATDNQGEVTDLLSACSELSIASRLIIRSGGTLPSDEDSQRRWRRLMGVGLCSVQKSINYWMEFPQEMPDGRDMLTSVYFNPVSGRPEKTLELEAFWGLVQRFALRSPAS